MSQIKKHDLPNSSCIFISFNFILYLPNWPKKLKIQKHKSCFSLCVFPAKLQSPIGNHEASCGLPNRLIVNVRYPFNILPFKNDKILTILESALSFNMF